MVCSSFAAPENVILDLDLLSLLLALFLHKLADLFTRKHNIIKQNQINSSLSHSLSLFLINILYFFYSLRFFILICEKWLIKQYAVFIEFLKFAFNHSFNHCFWLAFESITEIILDLLDFLLKHLLRYTLFR